jgi:hypothetical protein
VSGNDEEEGTQCCWSKRCLRRLTRVPPPCVAQGLPSVSAEGAGEAAAAVAETRRWVRVELARVLASERAQREALWLEGTTASMRIPKHTKDDRIGEEEVSTAPLGTGVDAACKPGSGVPALLVSHTHSWSEALHKPIKPLAESPSFVLFGRTRSASSASTTCTCRLWCAPAGRARWPASR